MAAEANRSDTLEQNKQHRYTQQKLLLLGILKK